MPERLDIWSRAVRFAGWALLGSGTLMLLLAAMNVGSSRSCAGVRIAYAPGGNGAYVLQSEVIRWLGGGSAASFEGKPLKDIDLRSMELRLEKEPWVSGAELYIDRNRVLHILVREREPVARIFTTEGLSFFIDSSLGMIPLNASHTPRVLAFTGLPVNGKSWSRRDSLLVREVRDMAEAVASDSLLSALVEQVDMDPVRGFVLVPKVGEHTIVAGDGRELEDKFRRLKIFYRQVMSRTGWSFYRELDLRFSGQVVAVPIAPTSMTRLQTGNTDSSVTEAKQGPGGVVTQPSPTRPKTQVKAPAEEKKDAVAGKPKAIMPVKE